MTTWWFLAIVQASFLFYFLKEFVLSCFVFFFQTKDTSEWETVPDAQSNRCVCMYSHPCMLLCVCGITWICEYPLYSCTDIQINIWDLVRLFVSRQRGAAYLLFTLVISFRTPSLALSIEQNKIVTSANISVLGKHAGWFWEMATD